MRVSFQEELDELESSLRVEGELVLRSLRGAVEAVCSHDLELADEVIAFDDDIDSQYFEVEQGIELLLARQTPVASDLRLVLAVLKDNLHLERMGDLCVTIAKLTKLTKGLEGDEALLEGFKEMGERAEQMIRVALRSLEQRDRVAAESLLELDELIDRANRRVVNRLLDLGHEIEVREWGLRMILVSRCLERIGDHAVDIGEQTAYLVTGEFREFTDASRRRRRSRTLRGVRARFTTSTLRSSPSFSPRQARAGSETPLDSGKRRQGRDMRKLIALAVLGTAVIAASAAAGVERAQRYGHRGRIEHVGPYTAAAAEGSRRRTRESRHGRHLRHGRRLRAILPGEIDLANASRPMQPTEANDVRCQNGVEYVAFTVANDGLAVVVNKENTWANCLTVAELKKIWEPGSKVNNWKDVRDGFPNEPLKLFGAGTDSGTFDYFTEAINGKAKASRSDYLASEDDNVAGARRLRRSGALGYFGYSYSRRTRTS